jgi:DNA topoisomerase-3
LTGRWEKRLKEIERGEFNAGTFINNMKKMVDELVYEVRSNKSAKRISSINSNTGTSNKTTITKSKKQVIGKICPKCNKGTLLKGSSAYGCSEFKNNCNFKIQFKIYGKKISDNQLIRLLDKGSTNNLKGFITSAGKVEGLLRFDKDFDLKLEQKESIIIAKENNEKSYKLEKTCPKCKQGALLKGKKAYGCANYNKGCDFMFTFNEIKKIANGKPLTKELVLQILLG